MRPTQEQVFVEAQEAVLEDYYYRRPNAPNSWARDRTFPYISMGAEGFKTLVKPYLKPNMHVIDVGCGGGDKLLRFLELEPTLKVYGLEHHPTMCSLAAYMVPQATIIQSDALHFSAYELFDLVYMFWPICDTRMMFRLKHRVKRFMKQGATLIIAGGPCNTIGWLKP